MKLFKCFSVLVIPVLLLIACNNPIEPTDPAVTTVVIQPREAKVFVGDSLQFTVSVDGTGDFDSGVIWQVNNTTGENVTYGIITQSGLYAAPDTVLLDSLVVVYVISVVDPDILDSALVTIRNDTMVPTIASVTVAPPDVVLTVGESTQFEAIVEGVGDFDSTVTWQVNNTTGGNVTYGTITQGGFYTTPTAVPPDSLAVIGAISVADSTKRDSAIVHIRAQEPDWTITSVTIAPHDTTIRVGEAVQFAATVNGTGSFDSSVAWYVNNTLGGNAEYGTITQVGFYTAPVMTPVEAQAVVNAISVADSTKSDSATIDLYAVTLVEVLPDYAYLLVGETVQFSALVLGTGSFSTSVLWFVNNTEGGTSTYGTITASGFYTTPNNVPPEFVAIVQAVSVADSTKHDSAVVELFKIDSVGISPQPDSIFIGYEEQFIATVHGTGNNVITDVTWLVNDVAGGSERYGYIDESGFYTAPDTVPLLLDEPRIPVPYQPGKFMWRQDTIVVTVKSAADPQNQDSASFFISSGILAMGVIPTVVVAAPNDTIQFTPVFYGDPVNTSVWWFIGDALPGHPYIEGGNEELGTISTDGLYIAPAEWPPVHDVWIIVRSPVDQNRYATGDIGFWYRP